MNEDKNEPPSTLSERIAAAQKHRLEKEHGKKKRSAYTGAQAGIEFSLSILVGGYGGYLLDDYLQTTPIFLILFFFLGVAAGFMSLFRASKNLGASVGFSELHQNEKQAKTVPKNEHSPSSPGADTEENGASKNDNGN